MKSFFLLDVFFLFFMSLQFDLNGHFAGLGNLFNIFWLLLLMCHDVALRVCYIIEVIGYFGFFQFISFGLVVVVEFDALYPRHIVLALFLIFPKVGLCLNCPFSTRKRSPNLIELQNRKVFAKITP